MGKTGLMEPSPLTSQQARGSPSPPLGVGEQPWARPPLPKMPVGSQWPLCPNEYFLFWGLWPVNSGDQSAGSGSPRFLSVADSS